MIMTMTDLVYVRLMINQYNIVSGQWSWSLGQGYASPFMGPDLTHSRASQPQYC